MRYRHQGQRVFDAAQADPRLRAGLVGWWVGDGSGLTLRDRSGYGNDGTVGSAVWASMDSPQSAALLFAGGAASVTTGHPLSSVAAFTITAWVKRAAANSVVSLGQSDSDANNAGLVLYSDGYCYFDVSNGGLTFAYFTLNDTAWHQIAMVYDGSQSTNGTRLRVFVDGVEAVLSFYSTVPSSTAAITAAFLIGSFRGFLTTGSIGPARVYNRALSAAEVALLASPSCRPVIPARRHAAIEPIYRRQYAIPGVGIYDDWAPRQHALLGGLVTASAAAQAAIVVQLPTITSGIALYGPTVAPGPVTLTGAYLPAGSVLYAGTVFPGAVTLTGAYLPSGAVLYSGTVVPGSISIVGAYLPAGSLLYGPTVAPGAVTVTGAYLPSGATLEAPTVYYVVLVPFIGPTGVTYPPTVVVMAGPGNLLLDDLYDYLTTEGVTDAIVLGRVSEAPADRAVFLIETGGRAPTNVMTSGPGVAAVEWPHVQVIARAPTYQGARQLAQQIFVALDGMPARTVNQTAYKWATALQPPFYLGRDDNGRTAIVCNYEIAKAISTSTTT